jgi:PAS domain S-box-containing protein
VSLAAPDPWTRALETRFRGLLDAAPDAMVLVDRDGRILLVNSQAEGLFGYAPHALQGLPVEALVPGRFRGGHPKHRADYSAEPRRRSMGESQELSALKRDGSEFPAEISLSPLEIEGRRVTIAAIRDVTERRAVGERLRRQNEELEVQYRRAQEANRLKSEFLANMSHELRTPLNAIIGFAELMHDGKVPAPADQKEFLGDILASSRHLLHLINDVLDLAKVESGSMHLRAEPVDLVDIVGETRNVLQGMADSKRLDLRVEIAAELGDIVADSERLKQVVYNLLSNAIKFTPEGGRVTVKVGPEDADAFRIAVVDTGIGIKPEDIGRLFVEFQQLDASTAKRYPGTGLGLALVRRLVEAQGGRVGVESTPGEGSVFFAVLPRSGPPGGESVDDAG